MEMEGVVGERGKGRSGHRKENTEGDLEVLPGIKPRSSSQEKKKKKTGTLNFSSEPLHCSI